MRDDHSGVALLLGTKMLFGLGVLELNEDVGPPHPIPGNQIAGEVAEMSYSWGEAVVTCTNTGVVSRPKKGGQVVPGLEEGEDLVPLLQRGCESRGTSLVSCASLRHLLVAEG